METKLETSNLVTTTVVIADDHEIIRGAISSYLHQATELNFKVSGIAENGIEAIAMVKSQRPNIVFLDISMPLANGSEIIHDIRRWSPDTKILIFTGITAAGLVASIIETGVDGMFSKSSALSDMFEHIPTILRGGRFIAPEFIEMIDSSNRNVTLTKRERQILNMVVAGKSNKDVATILNISPKTVDKHRTSFMAKLGVHSFSELMARALKDGLIERM